MLLETLRVSTQLPVKSIRSLLPHSSMRGLYSNISMLKQTLRVVERLFQDTQIEVIDWRSPDPHSIKQKKQDSEDFKE